jgi:hypothetical protein
VHCARGLVGGSRGSSLTRGPTCCGRWDTTTRRCPRCVDARRKLFALERDIEDYLAEDLRAFAPYHYHLGLRARQYVCRFGGRADLVCSDRTQLRHVVIDLKRGLITRHTVAQVLSYMASTQDERRPRKRPLAQWWASGSTTRPTASSGKDKRLEFIALDELAIHAS